MDAARGQHSRREPGEFVLRVVTARLVDGDPVPTEHDAVRWLRADELDQVRWAEADLPFLDEVRRLLDVG